MNFLMKEDTPVRAALTLIELLVVIAIIGTLVGLLLPAIGGLQHGSKGMSCANNLKQIGLAIHLYHDAHKQLPMHMSGTFDPQSDSGGTGLDGNNRFRTSFLVGLTPFIEHQHLWEQISNGVNHGGTAISAHGTCPLDTPIRSVANRDPNVEVPERSWNGTARAWSHELCGMLGGRDALDEYRTRPF